MTPDESITHPGRSTGVEYASKGAAQLLRSNGLDSLDAVFECGEPLAAQPAYRGDTHGNRVVTRACLDAPGGSVTVYVKRQWKRERLLPRFTELRRGVAFASTPELEWRGLAVARGLGLDAAEPLALFRSPGWRRRSAIVVRAVPVEHTLHDLLASRHPALDSVAREVVVERVHEIVIRMHESGWVWRSLKAKHLYPERLGARDWRVWMIDCEGIHDRPLRRDRARSKRLLLTSVRAADPDGEFTGALQRRLEAHVDR